MKFCKHCGNEVLDDAVICPKCGCSVVYTQTQEQPYRAPEAAPYADSYSGLSVAGFVLSFFFTLIGLIISIVAYNDAKRTGSQKSMTLSKAGIILSSVLIGIYLIVCIFMFFLVIAAGASVV